MRAAAEEQHARVNILFIAFGATLVGFLLVMLIGRGRPYSPAARESAPGEGVI